MRRGQPRNSAQHAQNRAFGEQLPNQAAMRRTDGQTDLDLPLSSHRAREKEIRDVRTRDHQHQANREAHRHDERHELLQIDERRCVGDVDSRGPSVSFADARCRHVDRSGSLCREHVRLQASVESNRPVPTLGVRLIPGIAVQLPPHGQGNPKVRHVRLSAHEPLGGDPDDLVEMAFEANAPTDERRVAAESPAPETLAQNNDRVRPRREIILRCQEPPERRLTAKHREIVAGNRQPEGELIARGNDVIVRGRSPHDGIAERHGERSERDHAVEYLAAVADVAILGDREVLRPSVAIQRIQPHQRFRLTNRQRTQHEGVEESERCGVDAHSQRQCRDRDGGKAGCLRRRRQVNRMSWIKALPPVQDRYERFGR